MSAQPMDPTRLDLLRRSLRLPSQEIAVCTMNADGGGDVFHLVDELLADRDHAVAELSKARRAICERVVHGRPGHEGEHDYDNVRDVAYDFGWTDLYGGGSDQ